MTCRDAGGRRVSVERSVPKHGDQTKAYDGIHYDQTLPARPVNENLQFFLRTQEKGRAGIPMTHVVYGSEHGRPLGPSEFP